MIRRTRAKVFAALFWLCAWQGLAMIVRLPLLLPSPVEVAVRWCELAGTAPFWRTVLSTLLHISVGFLSALLLGVLLALVSSRLKWAETLLAPLMVTIRSMPVASFAVLAVIWFSKENLSTLLALTMALPILYTNTLTGLRAIDPQMREMAEVFRIPTLRRIRCVYLPQFLPHLRSGIIVSVGLCWKSGVAAELIGRPKGTIGAQLWDAKTYLEVQDAFAWTVTVILLSLAFQALVLYLLKTVTRRLEKV
ncbi:MAG: ABC transporter permease subunit [Clostridia bacterium]|nr:ABC transporter permease subunit [Clostridia bacterium]